MHRARQLRALPCLFDAILCGGGKGIGTFENYILIFLYFILSDEVNLSWNIFLWKKIYNVLHRRQVKSESRKQNHLECA